MRLLQYMNGRFSLTEDLVSPPAYNILSHTWGSDSDEVTFKDIRDGTGQDKVGWTKLHFMAERSRESEVRHFWVDTCCINKDSEAELATAIRSMFKWYADAQICYVFLQDVNGKRSHDGTELWLQKCRWITRGWTLQELLAPSDVRFYGQAYLGDRKSLCDALHAATGIDKAALEGRSLESFSHKTRLGWAAGRRTKRVEDMAYCMLGLCGVVMSPLYGEGEMARSRLERKIIKRYGSIALEAPSRSTMQCDDPMERLKFDVIDSRKLTISKALNKTCAWLLTHPMFQAWQNGFFWLKGKPGAGKSVLVRFVDSHVAANKGKDDICISFYFHARGDILEKSFLGLYRSLLYQLLAAIPGLQSLLNATLGFESNIEALQTLFSKACRKLGHRKLYIFIDALDECKEEDVTQMFEFFQDLGQAAIDNETTILTCFASRHYPVLEVPTQLQLTLEDVHQHSKDLERYTRHHLKLGTPKHVDQVLAEILDKANGIFLWVVLVVAILKKEYKDGRIYAVQKRLKEIPPDLHELFKDIIQHDRENLGEFVLSLKWILYAMRPMELPEFYFALMVSLAESGEWDRDLVREDQMLRFMLSSSKGLAELTKGTKPTVQFIHESVRDFLLTDDGFRHIDSKQYTLTTEVHGFLTQCCVMGIHDKGLKNCDEAGDDPQADTLPQRKAVRASITSRFPFLEYATTFVLHHANESEARERNSSDSQAHFLSWFNLDTWQRRWNVLQVYLPRRYTGKCDLVYICAERDLAALIRTLAALGHSTTVRGHHRHSTPLFAAIANEAKSAVITLLSTQGASDAEAHTIANEMHPKLRSLRMFDDHDTWERTPWLAATRYGLDALALYLLRYNNIIIAKLPDDQVKEMMGTASSKGCCQVIRWLKAQGASFDRHLDKHYVYALQTAAEVGHIEVVKQLLLYEEVDINQSTTGSNTALARASSRGHLAIVELLLLNKAHISRPGTSFSPALYYAASGNHTAVIDRLIDAGADINGTDDDEDVTDYDFKWHNALCTAAFSRGAQGTVTVMRLLSHGADPNNEGNKGSALHAAQNKDIVKALLEYGADLNARRQRDNKTALQVAVERGNLEVARALLEAGASVADDAEELYEVISRKSDGPPGIFHSSNGLKDSKEVWASMRSLLDAYVVHSAQRDDTSVLE